MRNRPRGDNPRVHENPPPAGVSVEVAPYTREVGPMPRVSLSGSRIQPTISSITPRVQPAALSVTGNRERYQSIGTRPMIDQWVSADSKE